MLKKIFLLLLLVPTFIYAEDMSYSSFKVRGNDRVESQVIRKQIKLKPGYISSDKIRETIENIYKMGVFENVTAKVDGKALIFEVIERPAVRKIFIEGNKDASAETLAGIFEFRDHRIVDPVFIQELIKRAQLYYQTLGYLDAKFTYETKDISDGQVDLYLKVKEGKKFKISKVVINSEGLVNEDKVLDAIQTKRYKWWSSWLKGTGKVNQAYLEADKATIQHFLLDYGFVNGKVGSARIDREDDELIVTFDIEEGPVFHFGKLSAKGHLINDSKKETLALVDIEEGEVFSASKIREASFAISDEYADYGYAFANVVPETNINFKDRKVGITFDINKGKLVKVNKINITGNTKTYDNVIRREVRVDEQETYSKKEIEKSTARIRRTGFFEDVSVNPQAVAGSDDLVDLNVNVKEASTGSFSIGGGYSTGDGALFNAGITEANFLGTGRSVRLNADIGDRNENLLMSIDDSRFNDTYWRFGIEAYKLEREFEDFDRGLAGGSLTFGYPLEEFFGEWSEDINFSVKYQYLNTEISNVDPLDAADLVIASEGKSSASGFIPKFVRNTLDNPLNPTSGSRQTLILEYMGVGGDEEYYLGEFRNEMFFPLFDMGEDKFVFSWRVNVGYGETVNDEPFPLFRRFFPGGINSVRGYKARTMGPRDSRGNEFGGSKQLINNLEVIFPLSESAGLKGVLFYDVGDAFDDDVSIEFSELKKAAGFGFRWSSPLGPIRIEIGYPLDTEEGDKTGAVTQFSFGAPLY